MSFTFFKSFTNPLSLFLSCVIVFSSCNKQEAQTYLNLNNNWFFLSADDSLWLPASVPGTIHTDLINNNIIDDPFYRLNEHDVQWIDKKEWRYKTKLDVKVETLNQQNILLEFEGLDTYSSIYLNDSCLLKTDNMFRSYSIDVKNHLKLGENILEVLFDSPIKKGLERRDNLSYSIPISANDLAEIGQVEGNKRVSVFNRKAGYHFGWDWGPRLVTSGIWKPIILKSWNNFKISDVFIQQKLQNNKALINAVVELSFDKSFIGKEVNLEIKVSDDSYYSKVNSVNFIVDSLRSTYNIPIKINDPKLWWPNGMGDQNLYNVEIKVSDKNTVDSKSYKIGIRTIELVREQDSIGESFYFKVNGKPTFMKGVNYIPQDVFLTRPNQNNYEFILSSAAEANMNMIRVWGGGIYEKEEFYDLCDEKGLLVWQDFMFACAMYPGNDSFLENIKQEAIQNIKRLRNHTSLALWCGNNEVLTAWENWGWKENEIKNQSQEIADTIFKAYEDIFHKILPNAVSKYDNQRSYWPSSPGGGYGKKQKLESGNAHYWWVWWGKKPFSTYNDSIPRFMAEFGFQSFPEFNSVKKYTSPNDYDIYSEVMKSHQRSSIGNETVEEYLIRDYNRPKDFEHFLYVSQILQAHGIKIGIEAHRRNRHKCMGSLYWQLNDCWPVASWSGIDYFGKWKALHYTVKDVFSNFLISHEINNDSLEVFVMSDSLIDIEGNMQIDLIDFEGNQINSWSKKIVAEANSASIKMKIAKKDYLDNSMSDKSFLNLHFKDFDNKILAENKIFFEPYKELDLPVSNISFLISETITHFEIVLQTDKFAKNVFLVANSLNNFSDNFFDMMSNSKKTVRIKKEDGVGLELFKKDFRIITLDQTY